MQIYISANCSKLPPSEIKCAFPVNLLLLTRCGRAQRPVSRSPGRSVSWSPRMSSSLSRRSPAVTSRRSGIMSQRRTQVCPGPNISSYSWHRGFIYRHSHDQHLQLWGEEDQPLQICDQTGLQADHLEWMQVDYLVTINDDHKPNSFITREAPVETCNYKKVHLPTQELLHRKKCLLPDSKPESVGIKC